MIPKKIHYCWIGGKPLPASAKKCINSWKKYCPDYEIIEWNESNFDVTQNQYCKEAYEAQKWAFVSDFARLKIIYENGGIYLDTDVELLKPLTPFVQDGLGFIGFQNEEQVTTGLGFAAAKFNPCINEMLKLYDKISFLIGENRYNQMPCPVYNTVALKRCGLKTGFPWCDSIQELEGLKVYPIVYFNPMNNETGKIKLHEKTISIHHYSASWNTSLRKHIRKLKKFFPLKVLTKRTLIISRNAVIETEHSLNQSSNRER